MGYRLYLVLNGSPSSLITPLTFNSGFTNSPLKRMSSVFFSECSDASLMGSKQKKTTIVIVGIFMIINALTTEHSGLPQADPSAAVC